LIQILHSLSKFLSVKKFNFFFIQVQISFGLIHFSYKIGKFIFLFTSSFWPSWPGPSLPPLPSWPTTPSPLHSPTRSSGPLPLSSTSSRQENQQPPPSAGPAAAAPMASSHLLRMEPMPHRFLFHSPPLNSIALLPLPSNRGIEAALHRPLKTLGPPPPLHSTAL
jgi:hypothetical protein